MEPLDRFPRAPCSGNTSCAPVCLYSRTTNTATSNTQERALAPSIYTSVTPPVMQSLSNPAKQDHTEHLLPPSRRVNSKSSMHNPIEYPPSLHIVLASPPTITRPHRTPTVSLTEGQQQVLHAQPKSTCHLLHIVMASPPTITRLHRAPAASFK